MSEPTLPDDLSAWPTDPYRLLGVDRTTEPRAIRKAYHQLIRRFKPEHAPEAFRRIREAFEATQRFNPRDGDDGDEATAAPDPTGEPPWAPVAPAPASAAADLWEQACAGDHAAAYQGLIGRWERGTHGEDLFLQLYWLLAVAPDLGPDQTPIDWLIRGLQACGPAAGRLRELWCREVEADPASATSGASRRLLDAGTPVSLVSFVVDARWRAARRYRDWGVITTDLDLLRVWLPAASVLAWARCLLLAAENLAWVTGRSRDDLQFHQLVGQKLHGPGRPMLRRW